MKHKILKDLQKVILKEFGKRCSEYAPLCSTCEAWRAYDYFKWMLPEDKKDL